MAFLTQPAQFDQSRVKRTQVPAFQHAMQRRFSLNTSLTICADTNKYNALDFEVADARVQQKPANFPFMSLGTPLVVVFGANDATQEWSGLKRVPEIGTVFAFRGYNHHGSDCFIIHPVTYEGVKKGEKPSLHLRPGFYIAQNREQGNGKPTEHDAKALKLIHEVTRDTVEAIRILNSQSLAGIRSLAIPILGNQFDGLTFPAKAAEMTEAILREARRSVEKSGLETLDSIMLFAKGASDTAVEQIKRAIERTLDK